MINTGCSDKFANTLRAVLFHTDASTGSEYLQRLLMRRNLHAFSDARSDSHVKFTRVLLYTFSENEVFTRSCESFLQNVLNSPCCCMIDNLIMNDYKN